MEGAVPAAATGEASQVRSGQAVAHAVARLFDGNTGQRARPWGELFVRPTLPIRENFVYRFLVNLAWFSRNYLTATVVVVGLLGLCWPLLFAPLFAAVALHAAPHRAVVWKVAQGVACAALLWYHGVLPLVAVAVVVTFGVCCHAVLTPYTDEASAHYDAAARSHAIPAPHTPVMEYVSKTPAFPNLESTPAPVEDEPLVDLSGMALPPAADLAAPQRSPRPRVRSRGATMSGIVQSTSLPETLAWRRQAGQPAGPT